jgi:hypothetical protein
MAGMECAKYYDDDAGNPPFTIALAEGRRRASCEGWCYQHGQALIVSIDQYAEAATGNRSFFLDKPQSIGGSRRTNDNIP